MSSPSAPHFERRAVARGLRLRGSESKLSVHDDIPSSSLSHFRIPKSYLIFVPQQHLLALTQLCGKSILHGDPFPEIHATRIIRPAEFRSLCGFLHLVLLGKEAAGVGALFVPTRASLSRLLESIYFPPLSYQLKSFSTPYSEL